MIRVARTATPAVVAVSRRGGSGSGIIVRADGIILTNAHVVGSARTVEVRTADGRTFTGDVLGLDPSVDTAVVRGRRRTSPPRRSAIPIDSKSARSPSPSATLSDSSAR